MDKKKALIISSESLFSDIISFTLEKLLCEADVVENPKDAVNKIEQSHYDLIVISDNNGTIVKAKLAEILYNKASIKPHIIIFKKAGEMIPKEFFITVIQKPNFHDQLAKVVEKLGLQIESLYRHEKVDLANFIKVGHFKEANIFDFFKNLKGNLKFHIKSGSYEVLGFIMGTDIFILHSTLGNIYDILTLENVKVATEPMNLNEFLSMTLEAKTFKSNLRDFLVNAVSQISDAGKLLSFLPDKNFIVSLRAPTYIIKQVDIIENNINVDKLKSDDSATTIGDLLEGSADINKLKALVCMYILNMIGVEKPVASGKYDVKIKRSFLKKIIDKIRGL